MRVPFLKLNAEQVHLVLIRTHVQRTVLFPREEHLPDALVCQHPLIKLGRGRKQLAPLTYVPRQHCRESIFRR